MSAECLDEPVKDWQHRHWDIYSLQHEAAAYRVLKKRINLALSLDASYGGPCLEFHRTQVKISHPLALSLLQARLLDLNLPIRVRLKSAAVTRVEFNRQIEEFVRASMTDKTRVPTRGDL